MARMKEINKDKTLLLWIAGMALLYLYLQMTTPSYDVVNVGAREARVLIDNGASVIDVRGVESYNKKHIPGAISLPLDEIEKGIPANVVLDKTKPQLIYCGDGVTIGPKATFLLNQAGYTHAVNLEKGIAGWKQAGFDLIQ